MNHDSSIKHLIVGENITTPNLTTTKLLTHNLAVTGKIIITNENKITNGFQANGNFLLTSTSDLSEWTIHPHINFYINESSVLIGNKIGQFCTIYFKINMSDMMNEPLELKSTPFFTAIPESFQPGTETACTFSIISNKNLGVLNSTGSWVFDTHNRQVFFLTPSGAINPGDTFFGTIQYLKP